ncbi:MAG: ankyrin repeat domain-containing protein [Verrucomicrobia bacterium]|nr:ankyrin repeat domain-containing protein [Verrucomicrobiota bacterium]
MNKAAWFCTIVAAFLLGCGQSREQAVQELEKLNLKFTPDDFVQSAEKGDFKAVQLFLNAGMDCDAQSAAGATALMAAAKNGRIDVVKKLLDQKVNVNALGKQGVTALMLAAENNQVEIVKLLLNRKADPNVEDQTGWTALMKAVYQGNTDCVAALAARSRQEVNRGLLIAALTGHKEIAKILLDNGAEVDTRAEDGRTPLMLAAAKGDNDLVSFLLSAGADPTCADKSGATAGSFATTKGYKELADRLHQAPVPPRVDAAPSHAAASGSTPEPVGAISDHDLLSQPQGDKRALADSRRTGSLVNSAKGPIDAVQTKPATVVEIEQEFLPVKLTEVNGKKAMIQAADGESYSVTIGDQLKGLDYKVTDVVVRNTEDKDGNPVDDSLVKLRNTKSGQSVALIKGIPAQEHAAYAILAFPGSDQTLKIEVDQTFAIPSDPGHTYQVLDIRPAQVIIRRLEDNRVLTLEKGAHS